MFLLRFCRQLKRQPFYKSVLGPLLQNCFLESLINYMSRKCYDPMDQLDRKPCCETSKFPYSAKTFVLCLERAMKDLHNTPAQFFMPSIAGPKFDMRRQNSSAPRAIVIQYDSSREFSLSYEEMEAFYTEASSKETFFSHAFQNNVIVYSCLFSTCMLRKLENFGKKK